MRSKNRYIQFDFSPYSFFVFRLGKKKPSIATVRHKTIFKSNYSDYREKYFKCPPSTPIMRSSFRPFVLIKKKARDYIDYCY